MKNINFYIKVLKVKYAYLCILLFIFVNLSCENNVSHTNCEDDFNLFQKLDFKIGTAIDFINLNDTAYKNLAIKHFNRFTPENSLKFASIHPEQDYYNWQEVDSLVAFGKGNSKTNNIEIHGHTLIWHQQLPPWVLEFKGSKSEWVEILKSHIFTVMTRYKENIKSWDVVNEAFNEDGTLRNSIWRQNIGDEYIELAFEFAHQADPNALLFYNDFYLEVNQNKLNSTLRLLNNLRKKGIKVDGIGFQMHINKSYLPELIIKNINLVSKNDFKLHISEFDISVNYLSKDINLDNNLLNQQANLYYQIIKGYLNIPEKYQFGITFWGISDRYSWIRSYYNRMDYPLLFDDELNPKPAFCRLRDLN